MNNAANNADAKQLAATLRALNGQVLEARRRAETNPVILAAIEAEQAARAKANAAAVVAAFGF